jgi:hypothetical protein
LAVPFDVLIAVVAVEFAGIISCGTATHLMVKRKRRYI